MGDDNIRDIIVHEYERRYPDWTDIRVTDLIDYFGVCLAVVHANADKSKRFAFLILTTESEYFQPPKSWRGRCRRGRRCRLLTIGDGS